MAQIRPNLLLLPREHLNTVSLARYASLGHSTPFEGTICPVIMIRHFRRWQRIELLLKDWPKYMQTWKTKRDQEMRVIYIFEGCKCRDGGELSFFKEEQWWRNSSRVRKPQFHPNMERAFPTIHFCTGPSRWGFPNLWQSFCPLSQAQGNQLLRYSQNQDAHKQYLLPNTSHSTSFVIPVPHRDPTKDRIPPH